MSWKQGGYMFGIAVVAIVGAEVLNAKVDWRTALVEALS